MSTTIDKKKAKVELIIITIIIIILLIAAAAVWVMSKELQKREFKVYIDDQSVGTKVDGHDLMFIEDNKIYFSIKDMASKIGYRYYPGGYKQYSEDASKCYVTNNKELVTFSNQSAVITKYPLLGKDNNDESQDYTLSNEVIQRSGILYIEKEGLTRACNLYISYDPSINKITIRTLSNVAERYQNAIENAKVYDKNTNDSSQDEAAFNNQKALLSGLCVIQDPQTQEYGVRSTNRKDTEPIIAARYKYINFMEGSEDFLVENDEGYYGIIGKDGIKKVDLQYLSIKRIDSTGERIIFNISKK